LSVTSAALGAKLGGSFARSRHLCDWLDALGPRVRAIVPGGGPFTTATAELQRYWGFSDAAAHRMAILGMAQYGLMLHALRPVLATATCVNDLTGDAHPPGRIWLPALSDMDGMQELPADWTVSADSIALWLAMRLGAGGLVLVKSRAPAGRAAPPARPAVAHWAQLAGMGVVDAHFPEFAARVRLPVVLYGPDESARFIVDHADRDGDVPGADPAD